MWPHAFPYIVHNRFYLNDSHIVYKQSVSAVPGLTSLSVEWVKGCMRAVGKTEEPEEFLLEIYSCFTTEIIILPGGHVNYKAE